MTWPTKYQIGFQASLQRPFLSDSDSESPHARLSNDFFNAIKDSSIDKIKTIRHCQTTKKTQRYYIPVSKTNRFNLRDGGIA